MNRKVLLGLMPLLGLPVGDNRVGPGRIAPNFGVSSLPSSIVGALGAVSPPVRISVTPYSGFVGSVTLSIEGLPPGVSSSPPPPFSVVAGDTAKVSFNVDTAAALGWSMLTIHCTSGPIRHSVQVALLLKAVDTSYQAGSILYLESKAHGETIRVGVDSQWGGSMVELSWNGINTVNRFDSGREVQVALYDGAAKYDFTGRTDVFGWDPVQAGDRYSHGSPVLRQGIERQSIYIKTQPNEWYPDNKGGGPKKPVLTDTYIEQWISVVPEHWHTFKVHYKITHFGTDEHENSFQEFPAVYVNAEFKRFAYYAGSAPWTGGPVTIVTLPTSTPLPLLYTPEQWGAFVNDSDIGLTVYVPNEYPYGVLRSFPGTPGPRGHATNYYRPQNFFSIAPNAVIEGDVYLVVGSYRTARDVVRELRNAVSATDPFAPIGYLDAPTSGSDVRGVANVRGWAFDNVAVSAVQVFVDGVLAGTAKYGLPRPDVNREYPNAPLNVAFSYALSTAPYANGWHALQVKVTDNSGNVALFPPVTIRISN